MMDKEEFIKTLSKVAPENCDLKVGDTVKWTNDYGVEWEHKIIGFNYVDWYQKKYKCYVHFDSESFWFSHNHLTLTKI